MKKPFFFTVLSSLVACLSCADYADSCRTVTCNSPPGSLCLDGRTVRVWLGQGTCIEGECHYYFEDISCAEGECRDGICADCQPECSARECGPDPRCGHPCGDCLDCDGLPDPSLCTPEAYCLEVCCPDCTYRECGNDGCGGSCGGCEYGCECRGSGHCECECEYPEHSRDCSEVSYFQCGFWAWCGYGRIYADWHEHIECGGQEQDIVNYSCYYDCPNGCDEEVEISWAQTGQQLVDEYCLDP